MAQPSEDADAQAGPRKSRVRNVPRPAVKGQALLTGPGEEKVTRGGLVFDETVDPENLRAIFTRSTVGHRDWGKFVGDVFSQWFHLEGEDESLIEAIEELNERIQLQAKLWDTVKHAGIDGTALLYKNFSDTAAEPSEEVAGVKELVSLLPIYDPDIDNLFADTDRKSRRFGLLDTAKVTIRERKGGTRSKQLWRGTVHHSRLFHVAWEPLYGSLRGSSYFEPSHDGYKALKNIEWAMGETMHRNAAGTKTVDPGPDATDTEIDELFDSIKDLDASKELMVPPGTKITTIKPQPIPPKEYAGYFLKTVSTMPETLLVGAHEGAVTGSETNLRIYFGDVQIVQEQFVTPLLKDFYRQLQALDMLPKGELPTLVWEPVWTLTQDQEAMVWERKARASRMLAGNELKGDTPLMTPREIRRLILGLDPAPAEEDVPPAIERAFRSEQREIDPEDRDRFIGLMARATDPVIASWSRALLAVNEAMRRDVIRKATDLLAQRLGDRRRFLRLVRIQQLSPGEIREAARKVAAATEPHLKDLSAAVRAGFRDAILAGLHSVKLPGIVGEQELPEGMETWWEANSTQWSTTMSRETVEGINATVREGLEAGDSMAELEARLGSRFDLKQHELERIARTETIRAASEGRIREYRRLGVKRLIFMSTPDDRTGPECWSLDGQSFSVEAASGIIPVHPNCRCTWVAERELNT